MNYLKPEDILAINQSLIQKFGGVFGLTSETELTQALERPSMKIDDYEPFPSLWAKAAVLMDSLIKAQCFVNQNTATALMSSHIFLRQNGYLFHSLPEDIEYIQGMYLHQFTTPQLAEWLKLRSEKI